METFEYSEQFLQTFDRNVKGKFSYLPNLLGSMLVNSIDHVRVIDSNLNCDIFNIICCEGTPQLSSIHAAIDHFRSKKLPYAFWIGFQDEPFWLEEELLKLGLITEEMEWAMACNLSQNSPKSEIAGIEVKKVSDHAGIQDVVDVMCGIFPEYEHSAIRTFYNCASSILLLEDTKLNFFVGYENRKPVSLVSVYFDEGLASVFDVIVLPQTRGKGIGQLMTVQAMLESKRKGFDICILTATNDAKYLYQKLGFTDVKIMKVYHEHNSKKSGGF